MKWSMNISVSVSQDSNTWFVDVLPKLLVHVAQRLCCRQTRLRTPFAILLIDKSCDNGISRKRVNGLDKSYKERTDDLQANKLLELRLFEEKG